MQSALNFLINKKKKLKFKEIANKIDFFAIST